MNRSKKDTLSCSFIPGYFEVLHLTPTNSNCNIKLQTEGTTERLIILVLGPPYLFHPQLYHLFPVPVAVTEQLLAP